jgi:hypothetical protein
VRALVRPKIKENSKHFSDIYNGLRCRKGRRKEEKKREREREREGRKEGQNWKSKKYFIFHYEQLENCANYIKVFAQKFQNGQSGTINPIIFGW